MQHLQPNTTLQGGKYRIDRVLGQGGFGNTYMGFNTEFEETVAIKEFFMKGVTERDETTRSVSVSNAENVAQFEEQREKFKKEARRLRKLKNAHIVKVHDLFEENGTAYYVMDFIDGESTAERLKRTGVPFSETEVRSILQQVLEALKEVHQNEIWHLDLKPGNIMLDKQGTAYLIDFGASKQIRSNGSMTTSTALCYTPGYAPNEQIGQMYDRFGPWTDIYALGATVYNLLTNKKPPMAIDIEEDEEDAFSFPSSTSEDMKKLVVWMMQPKRKARPQKVEEIIISLNSAKSIEKPQLNEKTEKGEETTVILKTDRSDVATPVENDKEQTLLQIAINGKEVKPTFDPKQNQIERAIQIGDFIFEDGSFSDKKEKGKESPIGVLFSYYGGTHGRILSSQISSDILSINGRELEWHIASISEWVDIIQNLCHIKVSYQSWEYEFFDESVYGVLYPLGIKEERYVTSESVSGISYIVDLVKCKLTRNPIKESRLPYIYVAEF